MSDQPIDLTRLPEEAARRRTFAIISHPDAGKTTLTEKLLLYSGAIHLAGSVKSRKASRHAVSDWMKIEQERGISITSSVLQFEYLSRALNLLDTPGHADFSEDTYRTLAAVDSAVMLIDNAKGVEARTLKLFEVCRMRKLPIVTFINKLDRPGLEPLDLIDEVGRTLNLRLAPITWPIGQGKEFRGVVDLRTREVVVYAGEGRGESVLHAERVPLSEAHTVLDARDLAQVHEDLELLEVAGDVFDPEAFARGELSPVFWGSAMTNFGVETLLAFMAENAAPPGPRQARLGSPEEPGDAVEVRPDDPNFTGFVFKIQANMNPRHRDRVAFVRVVSGTFERGADVIVGRSGETLRLTAPHTFMAQERSIVDEAWPGDIVGLYDPGNLRIGDTLAAGTRLRYEGIPRFAPEFFVRVILKDPLRRKQLDAGLRQLSHEGVVQLFFRPEFGRQDPYLGAVGLLQFEVLKERLETEYRAKSILESLPFRFARWIGGKPEGLAWLRERRDYPVLEDRNGNPVLLAESSWPLRYALEHAPGLELYEIERV
jgi:peptide chain release factor 3